MNTQRILGSRFCMAGLVGVVFLLLAVAPVRGQTNIPSWAANCPPVNLTSTCGCAPNCLPRRPMFRCTLPNGVLTSVNALFPEGRSPDPSLLGNLAPIKIFFNQRSNINFTFVTEGAGYRNQFGFFLYNQSNPNLAGTAYNFTTVFPDVSFPGTGCLASGHTVDAGQVPANTFLGFWVIANGYNGGTDRWVSFTDGSGLINGDGFNHTGFVYLSDLNTTLFGFEDLRGLGDKDYNDVMFTFATDGIIDLNQIPRYEGGLIQTCRVGVIASDDYLEYKCQQWALLSAPTGASCNSFLTPPTGWTFALNNTETLEMLQTAGFNTFSRTLGELGCAVVRLNNLDASFANYSAGGAACASDTRPTLTPFGSSSSCFATQCSNRILIRGSTVSSCSVNTFSYCDPAVGASLVSRVPSNLPVFGDATYASTQNYPNTANVFLAPGNTISFNISTILKTPLQGGISADVFILFDMYNAFAKDRDLLSQGLVTFFNELTNPATTGFDIPNIGFGTYRRTSGVTTVSNNCPLSPDVTATRDCIAGVSFSGIQSGSATVQAPVAAQLAMSALNGQFRSFAYKVILIITDNPTEIESTLATQQVTSNMVPLFFNPNPASSIIANYTSIVNSIPYGRRFTGTPRSSSNLGDSRLSNWFNQVPPLVKQTLQNITMTRMINTPANQIPNGFLQTLAGALDVSALPAAQQTATFNRAVTVGWNSAADLASFPIRATITTLGFGRTDVVISTNRAPVAPDTPITTDEDTPITFSIAATDIDNNLMRIRFTAQTNAALGTLFTSPDNVPVSLNTFYNNTFSFRYVPGADLSGVATYSFFVTDGCANSVARTLTITVRPVNDPPTARDFTIFVGENDASLSNIARILFNSSVINDIDTPVASLTISIVTVPNIDLGDLVDPLASPSAVTIRNTYNLDTRRRVDFTPAAYKDGTTNFLYRVSDGSLTADATVTIVVVDARWPPVLTVTPNPLTADVATVTSFTMSVTDPDGLKSSYNERVTIQASLINLSAGNSLMVPTVGLATLSAGSPTTTWTSPVSVPVAGLVDIVGDWTADLTTIPQNISLTAFDDQGRPSNTVILRLIVSGNRPPRVENNPGSVSIDEDNVLGPLLLQGTDDDFKSDLDTSKQQWRFLSIQFTSVPSNGVLRLVNSTLSEIVSAGSVFPIASGMIRPAQFWSQFNVTYTPVADYNGPDSFAYVFIDSEEGVSVPATVSITVNPVNDQPTTSDFTVTMDSWHRAQEPAVATIDEFSAFDPDTGDVLSLRVLSLPALGKLKFQGNEITASQLPFNVGVRANWALTYEPPFLGSSDPDGSEYARFNFVVCDDSNAANNCSNLARVRIIVNFINTPPTSESFDVYTPENTWVSFALPASDPDQPRHNDSVLFASVTSLGVRNKGKLYLCAAMNSACELTVDRVNEVIRSPRRLWYVPLLNDYSTPDSPAATLRFQVGDDTLNTAETYTVRIFVDFINDPPEWRAATTYNIDEDTSLNLFTLATNNWWDDLLLVPSNQENPPVPVVSFSVISLPQRGSLSLCSSDTCTVIQPSELPATSNDPLGRVIFRPLPDESDNGYAQFVFALTDSGNPFGPPRSLNVTITVNVIPVNDPPVVQAQFPTVAQGGDGPVINEDSNYVFIWRLTDVDTLPDLLVTRIVPAEFSRAGWTVFDCKDDGFAGCSPDAVIASNTDKFSRAVFSFEVANTTCNFTPGRPITNFDGCYADFIIQFVPEANRYQIPFIQLTFLGYDQLDLSEPTITILSVLPVNDPPQIYAPALISPAAGVTEMDILDDTERPPANFNFTLPVGAEKTKGVFVFDPDANYRGSTERLTVAIIDGDGVFLPAPSLNCNQTSDFVWECLTTLRLMNTHLKTSKFRISSDLGFTEAVVRWTLNDLGNTSPEDAITPLETSTTTRFVFTKLPEINTPPPPNNNLTLAVGLAAAAGLVLIALLVWRLRKSLKAPDDKYFEVATSSIAVAPTNPLFKPQFQDRQNPLYRG